MLWGLKSSLLAYIFKYIRLDTKPVIQVSPQFNTIHFSTHAASTFHIRVYNIFQAGFLLLLRVIKIKGGLRIWHKNLFNTAHNRS